MHATTKSRLRSASLASRLIRRVVDRVELVLPVPPSTNGLFFNRKTGGRGKTKAYREWIAESGWRLLQQYPGRIEGRYEIDIYIAPDCPIDADNFKAVSDLLQSHGVIENDRLAWRFQVSRTGGDAGVRVVLQKAPM